MLLIRIEYITRLFIGSIILIIIASIFIKEYKKNKQKSKLDRRSKEEMKRKLKSIKEK